MSDRKHDDKALAVEWIDSESGLDHAWHTRDQVQEFANKKLHHCWTIGVLVGQSEESITLALSTDCDDQLGPHIKIPKSNIRRVGRIEIDWQTYDGKANV